MGTKLTDAKFFGELLDTTFPGLEGIPAAAAAGDYAACRKLFAAHVRQNLQPERYLPHVADVMTDFLPELIGAPAEKAVKNIVAPCGFEWDFGEGPVDWFFNPTYNGYKEWTWQLSRHPEWRSMVRAWRATGDDRYAQVVAGQLRGWIEQAQAPDPSDGGTTLCWRTIECGIRLTLSWPEVLHTLYRHPALDDDLLTDWCKSMWEHGERLRRDHRTANWLIMEMAGLAHVGLLFPCFRQAEHWLAYALEKLEGELRVQVYPDGFQYELSTSYQMTVLMNYMIVIRLLKAYDRPVAPALLQGVESMLEMYVKLMRPDGFVPPLNDGRAYNVREVETPAAQVYTENTAFAWAASGGKAGKAPDFGSVVLPYAGMAALRTGWGKDDTYLFFDGGPFGRAHQHEDKLQVQFCAGGRYLLLDVGNYAYDTSAMRSYTISTRAHNTVRVDNMDQNRRKTYDWAEEDIEKKSSLQYKLGEEVDVLRAVYDEGYGEAQDKSITHERSVYFFKQVEGVKPFAVVVDRLTADAEHDYEVLWHLNTDSLALSGMHLHSDVLRMLVPDAPMETAGLSICRGVQHPDWQGWTANSGKQKDFRPIYTAQYWLHGQNIRWVTVLSQDDAIAGVEASLDVNDTTFTLKKADGTALTLDEAGLW